MAVSVVDAFEVIEVDENQGELESVAVRAVDFSVQHEIQMARVVEAGAIVGDGELVNALHVARIFDSDGRVVRERLQQGEIAGAETFGANAIDQFDDTEALIAETHGHGDDGARFHLCFRIYLAEETRVFCGVPYYYSFTGLRDPAC